jgi:uncharacterized protein
MGRVISHGTAVVLSLLWCACATTQPNVHLTTLPAPPLIKVSGDAMVNVAPDEVVFNVGVDTRDATVGAAKRRNDDAIQAIQSACVAHGVQSKDFQSDYLVVDPQYSPNPPQQLVGALAHRQLTVTLKTVSRFDELLAAVVEVGANTIYGIDFRTTQLKAHRMRAREIALEAAREKAVAMAKVLGRQVGAVYSIQEEPSSYWSSYYWGGRGQSQNMVQSQSPGSSDPEGTLAPGQISVSARVEVEFLLD